jgi:hypothetical protein
MNFADVPDRTAAEVRAVAENALKIVIDPSIANGLRSFLTSPRQGMRTWDWNKPYVKYPVWVVAESTQYDYGIVFSDYGFAPENPWGLVFLSHTNFDADYCWYRSLEEAYKDSRLIEEFEEKQRKG